MFIHLILQDDNTSILEEDEPTTSAPVSRAVQLLQGNEGADTESLSSQDSHDSRRRER